MASFSARRTKSGVSVSAAAIVGMGVRGYVVALATTLKQVRIPGLTVMLILGLAYLMNYSGMNYTLGLGVSSAGVFFPLLSPFLGWIAVIAMPVPSNRPQHSWGWAPRASASRASTMAEAICTLVSGRSHPMWGQ